MTAYSSEPVFIAVESKTAAATCLSHSRLSSWPNTSKANCIVHIHSPGSGGPLQVAHLTTWQTIGVNAKGPSFLHQSRGQRHTFITSPTSCHLLHTITVDLRSSIGRKENTSWRNSVGKLKKTLFTAALQVDITDTESFSGTLQQFLGCWIRLFSPLQASLCHKLWPPSDHSQPSNLKTHHQPSSLKELWK